MKTSYFCFRLFALSGLCQGITLDHDEFSINLLPSQVNIQTVQLVDETPADLLDMIKQKNKDRPYLKYYYSSEKFVPTQELNVVCKFLPHSSSFHILNAT